MSPINDSTFRALFDDLFLELTDNSIYTASERIVGSQAALGFLRLHNYLSRYDSGAAFLYDRKGMLIVVLAVSCG